MSEHQLDAFPEAVLLSPRLQWLAKHNLTTKKLESGRWRCFLDDKTYGVGATEAEAIISYCIKTGVKHWNLDG